MLTFFRKILRLVKPYKSRFVLGIFCGLLSGLFAPALPLTIKIVTEVVFPQQHDSAAEIQGKIDNLKQKLEQAPAFVRKHAIDWLDRLPPIDLSSSNWIKATLILCIPLVMLIRGILAYLNVYMLAWVGVRVVNDLRVRLFDHLLGLPLSFFNHSRTGELMARINETTIIQNTIVSSVSVIVREPVTVVSLVVLLFMQQTMLTVATLMVFPICLIPVIIFGRKLRQSTNAMQSQLSDFSSQMHEAFTGYRVIKAYNLEQAVVGQFRQSVGKFTSFYMRMVRSTELPGPLIEFFAAVGIASFFVYLAVLTKATATPGDMVMFVGSIFLMYAPIKSIVRLQSQLEWARAANERVFELLEIQSSINDPPQPKPLRAANAEIRFKGIDFSFGPKQILKDINLTIKPGQLVALVGKTGAGKTTLTNLLLRFFDPVNGTITIGDREIREVTLKDLRSQIAVVTQETILFNDTIRNNIVLGRPGASFEEVVEAAKHAYAHDFIMEKPQGYDTVVGEKGAMVSGGQRQRLALARAILKNAPILILDEATSALDNEAERIVQKAIEELMQGRTTICIAHRLSTIYNADVIVVMDQGRIVEMGRHAELLARGGIYQRLHELQFQEPVAAGP